jgi:hypothetical protein
MAPSTARSSWRTSLRSLPCRYAQGFLFGRAAAADDADRLVLGQTPPPWAGAEGAYLAC